MKIKKLFWTRKQLIKAFAKQIADLQMKADRWYYVNHDQKMSSYFLDKVFAIRGMTHILGITEKVYEEAYTIYDFRNSGKEGFVPNMELLRSI